jgi:hypothetical protein
MQVEMAVVAGVVMARKQGCFDLITMGEKQKSDLPTHDGLAIVLLLRHGG